MGFVPASRISCRLVLAMPPLTASVLPSGALLE
jgi:hypothetical protein